MDFASMAVSFLLICSYMFLHVPNILANGTDKLTLLVQ